MKLFVRGILFLVNYWYEMQGIAQVNEIMYGADLYIYIWPEMQGIAQFNERC